MDSESSFPRGSITTKKIAFSNAIDNIFASSKRKNEESKQKSKGTRKRKRAESFSDAAERNMELLPASANIFTYEQVEDGMLVLGCIRIITPFSIEVELPGKMSGKIQVSYISDLYTQFLQEKVARKDIGEAQDLARLQSIFHVGQYIPTKVIQKINTPKGTKLSLSMNPSDIYADWTHRVMQKGLLVWAAIESELDHGYQLDAGIDNCRIFLPHGNVPKGTIFVVGQPLWCAVLKCDINVAASTITVSILENHMKTAMQGLNLNLHHLVPGMQFGLTITKVLRNGLQGKFMSECCGFVNEAYLTKPLEQISNYKEGQGVQAYLLYIQPTTKFGYFSLRSLQLNPHPKYPVGTILKSKVISRAWGGINIKLSSNEKGFVSFKRIVAELSNKAKLNNVIAKKYAPGSLHQCRILDYQRFEQVYICTFEQAVLKQKIFSFDDVTLGELVNVEVISCINDGLVVHLGRISGFIQNLHLSNVRYSENIKRKFKVGQNLKARVWSIDDKRVSFTHKQAFLDSDLCLCKIDDAVVNKQYPGLVAKNCRSGVLVVFYGGVRGWLTRSYLNQFYGDNSETMFYEGQVIMTTVKSIGHSSLILVLDTRSSKSKAIRVGEYVDGTVIKITGEGLEIEAEPDNTLAFLPVNHLSSSLPLTTSLLETYNVGSILNNLLCISNKDVPILSLREGIEYKRKDLKVGSVKDLTVGSLVRCSYESSDTFGIVVSIPFIRRAIQIRIPAEEVISNPSPTQPITFQPQQSIIAKVTRATPNKTRFKFTVKLEEVFSWNYEESVDYLGQYLLDIKQIQQYLLGQDSPLAKLRLGQHVQCTLNTVSDSGCSVLLEHDVQGFIPPQHSAKRLKRGQKLLGVVLWVNFKEQYAVVSVAQRVLKKVNPIQDGIIDQEPNSLIRADVLIVHDDYAVAVTQNKQLVCLPTFIHTNAFDTRINYEEMQKIKLIIVRKVDDMLIAVERKLKHKLQKLRIAYDRGTSLSKEENTSPNIKKRTDKKTNPNKRARLEFNNTSNGGNEDSSPENSFEVSALDHNQEEILSIENDANKMLEDDSEDELEADDDADDDNLEADDDADDDNLEADDEEILSIENDANKMLEDDSEDELEADDDNLEADDDADDDNLEADDDADDDNLEADDDEILSIENDANKMLEDDSEDELEADDDADDDNLEADDDADDGNLEADDDADDDNLEEKEDVSDENSEGEDEQHSDLDGSEGESFDSETSQLEDDSEDANELIDDVEDNEIKSEAESSSESEDESTQVNTANNAVHQNGFDRNKNTVDLVKSRQQPSTKAKKTNDKNAEIKQENVLSALPGIQNFFDADSETSKKVHFEDSSDDEMVEELKNSTKKKLTPAERRALVRQEEERLTKKEIEIANCSEEPQSEEQFCMLLTGKPNCSELWSKYIAYCISNAEINKARNVGQTALEKIDLQATEERYNIWIVLLNLENRYGDKSSFTKVFEEAVKCNDDLQIYLEVIRILADSQKYAEMEEKIKKARNKYRKEPKMWLEVARTYYKINQLREARNLQNAALKSIEKKAKHVDLIVQFAILEFQYGESHYAETLFESVLQSAPKRVDIWCTYVDLVIKNGNTDGARRILERAVSQSIPIKKMKILFKKFKDFEMKYGDQQRVQDVIELARKYVGLADD